jgi:redox-sensitive bicupin YhaK (pirin superfamily)
MQPGAVMEILLPKEHNAFVYILEGEIEIKGSGTVQELHAAVFSNDGEAISLTAMKDTKALLMSGTPIGEALVSYGPFVMNSQDGIRKAMVEYQMGLYGEVVEG